MRLWKYSGTESGTDLPRKGILEALTHEDALKNLNSLMTGVELEDQGPIFFYIVKEDTFQKATSEVYALTRQSEGICMKATPSDDGRRWDLFMPNATTDLLYKAHQVIEGQEKESPRETNSGVQVMELPIEALRNPNVLSQIVSQIRSRSFGNSPTPQTPLLNENNNLDSRELMMLFHTHAQLYNTWMSQIDKLTSGPLGNEFMKEFKLVTLEYRRMIKDLMQLGVMNLSSHLPREPQAG